MKPLICASLLTWLVSAAVASTGVLITSEKADTDTGSGKTVFTGGVSVMFNGSSPMQISARTICHDFAKGTLVCSGDVKVTGAGRTIKSEEMTIEIGRDANVYRLDAAGIVIAPRVKVDAVTAEHLKTAAPFMVPAEAK